MTRARVLGVLVVKNRGPLIVLDVKAERGDVVRCGDKSWTILAVEAHCVANPPAPWGFLLEGTDPPPGEGSDVTIEKGPGYMQGRGAS